MRRLSNDAVRGQRRRIDHEGPTQRQPWHPDRQLTAGRSVEAGQRRDANAGELIGVLRPQRPPGYLHSSWSGIPSFPNGSNSAGKNAACAEEPIHAIAKDALAATHAPKLHAS